MEQGSKVNKVEDALFADQHPNSPGKSCVILHGASAFSSPPKESGPTLCGDESSDPELMSKLGAILQYDSGMKLYVHQINMSSL